MALVSIDRDTGRVTVEKLVAVDDSGTIVNPMIVEGQIHGSMAHGLGEALWERMVYDPEGQVLTGSLLDYPLATAHMLPNWTTGHFVTPSPQQPFGAKGAGEAGNIGAPPADRQRGAGRARAAGGDVGGPAAPRRADLAADPRRRSTRLTRPPGAGRPAGRLRAEDDPRPGRRQHQFARHLLLDRRDHREAGAVHRDQVVRVDILEGAHGAGDHLRWRRRQVPSSYHGVNLLDAADLLELAD